MNDHEGTIATIDIDENEPFVREYDVCGGPTFVVFANGESVERRVGYQNKRLLVDLVEQPR